jgi:hypothetical protein
MVDCFEEQLDTIQGAIEHGRDRCAVAALAYAYTPPVHTWDSEAWKAASRQAPFRERARTGGMSGIRAVVDAARRP